MNRKPSIALLVCVFLTTATASLPQVQTSHPASPAATKTLLKRLGYPADAKLLIVHADDLGMAHSINRASIKGLESGLVSSASIMMPCSWVPEIAAYARAHPEADLGLHLTLTSEWVLYRWGSVLAKERVPSLFDTSGYLYPTESEAAAHIDPKEAEAEIRAQITRARALGIQPTHLDSHMGTLYQTQALFETLFRVARDNKLLIRVSQEWFARAPFLPSLLGPDDVVMNSVISIGPDVTVEGWSKYYADAIKTLQPGITEMIVHLAYDDAEMRGVAFNHPDWGSAWRQRDFEFVTSQAFRKLLQENNVKLVTWREVSKRMQTRAR
ncbi:MAG TPA: polysaccharide deacetylase family protein [Pyrinomonadaceae bacterium]|nr:polysaccharide deacetylase family protein [Pyrinomonadaceae bacterium]